MLAAFGKFGLLGLVLKEDQTNYYLDRAFLWSQDGKAQFNVVAKSSDVCVKECTQEEFDRFAAVVNEKWQKNFDRFMAERTEYLRTHEFLK